MKDVPTSLTLSEALVLLSLDSVLVHASVSSGRISRARKEEVLALAESLPDSLLF